MTALLDAALFWHGAGCAVIPAAADGTKRPFGQWKRYMLTAPSADEQRGWFSGTEYDGLGIVCGPISGGLEMFELEGRAVTEGLDSALADLMESNGFADLWARIDAGYKERTPSGGVHWLYRVDGEPRGNMKLARRPATPDELAENPDEREKVLIETRGDGGFTIVAPSGGRTHPGRGKWERLAGSPTTIPTITEDERDALHAIAAMLDRQPAHEPAPRKTSKPRPDGELRPGDDFNARADWSDILVGWTEGRRLGGTRTWTRPGKDVRHGISATTGRNDGDNLYVFSSSTVFDTEKPYSKFAAYALLEHDGDYAAAAKALSAQGYGTRTVTAVTDLAEFIPTPPDPERAAAAQAADEEFWASRPALTHLQTYARARMTSPWAVLGVALCRVVTLVPPFHVLPPIVGSHASLNLFVALVGISGGGKGAAENTAADALDLGEDVYSATVGSGEGIGHLYSHREKREVVRDRDAVMFTVPEVDNLVALGSRQGATLMPQLRSAWSGERLGFAYADQAKALPLERHSYRMTLVLGVQPGRSGPLLDDADGGTPQRFLWLPTTDPQAPDELPPCPPPFPIHRQRQPVFGVAGDLAPMFVCDTARDTIVAARRARLRGDGDALDGHALLCRLKTAAALAILDGRYDVSEQDWHLSGLVLTVSDHTRAGVVGYLAAVNARANEAKGHGEAQRAVQVTEAVEQAAIKRVAARVRTQLTPGGEDGWVARSDLRRGLASRDRQFFEDALDALVKADRIDLEHTRARLKKEAGS